jgi:hypothetical protein
LQVPPNARIVHKGNNSYIDSYSAFFDNKKLGHTDLDSILRSHNVTDCFVCGIAYDVCVGESGQANSHSNTHFGVAFANLTPHSQSNSSTHPRSWALLNSGFFRPDINAALKLLVLGDK